MLSFWKTTLKTRNDVRDPYESHDNEEFEVKKKSIHSRMVKLTCGSFEKQWTLLPEFLPEIFTIDKNLRLYTVILWYYVDL